MKSTIRQSSPTGLVLAIEPPVWGPATVTEPVVGPVSRSRGF
jgi:hypothetical protein